MSKSATGNDRRYGRMAAGLFAATVVMTGGLGVCLMITFLFANNTWIPWVAIGCGFVFLCLMLWLLSDSPPRQAKDTNFYGTQKEQLDQYVESFRPKRRRRRGHVEFGTNKPPSADDVRQIKEDSNVWYPSERRADEYRKNLGSDE
jgi:hypothetical protein